jgi:O-antigen/teichoic acid export membrane protein
MEAIRTSLAASIAARGVGALLGLLALPIYLRFLGIEAYGVVGLFASLQAMVAFMDFGLPTTLTRQLAAAPSEPRSAAEGRDFLRTFEWVYLALAVLIAVALGALAPWVAAHWVKLGTLSSGEVAFSLAVAGLSLACGWPANLYSAGLAGLHRQIPLAVSATAFAILRVALAILFLWREPTLPAFFGSQVIASLLQSTGTRWQLWRAMPCPDHRPRLRADLLVRTRGFAGGMTMITMASILLTQMDKLILSHVLPLADFGVYAIAGSLAASLYILISPVFSVIYPRISTLWGARDDQKTGEFYHASAQSMALLVMPVAAVLICFPEASLFVLADSRDISAQAAPILVLMVIAAACNGIMNIPYALQLAAGWTSLSVWINVCALLVMAPATWWAAERFGAVGGAAAWTFLNVGYVILTPQLLHRRLLPAQKWRWYREDVLLPAAASFASALLLATIWPIPLNSRLLILLQLAICWLAVAAVTLAALGRLRVMVADMQRG